MLEKGALSAVGSISCRHGNELPPDRDDSIETVDLETAGCVLGDGRSHGVFRNAKRDQVAFPRFAATCQNSALVLTPHLDAVCEVREP